MVETPDDELRRLVEPRSRVLTLRPLAPEGAELP
jgi:hypothetical protein